MNKMVTHESEETVSGLPDAYQTPNASLAVSLARAEIDQQVATSRALPRSIQRAVSNITSLATLDEETAAECIYALPRGGKTIRGPSIRFAEIMASQWGNCRVGARVVHVDRIEAFVEAEGVFHDLETNVAQTARVRRTIQAKRGKGIDNDMIQLAGAAACSIARRNAILAGIPKGVARKGYLAVEEVIRGDIKTLSERRALALKAFGVLGVIPDRVFAALEVQGEDDITLDHLMTLTGTRSAIKNGELTVEEAFPIKAPNGDKPKGLGDALDRLAGEPKSARIKANEDSEAKTSDVSRDEAGNGGGAGGQPARSDNAPTIGSAVGEARASHEGAAPHQGPQEGAGAAVANKATPAPNAKSASVLADLIATGNARAETGHEALTHFLDDLEPGERAMLPNVMVEAWVKAVKARKTMREDEDVYS